MTGAMSYGRMIELAVAVVLLGVGIFLYHAQRTKPTATGARARWSCSSSH